MRGETLKVNIKRMRRNNPCFTLIQIGERYGVTRERVRQILKEAELPTKGEGTLYHRIPNQRFCLNCGIVRILPNRTHCSHKCRTEYATVKVTCTQCGLQFQLKQGAIIARTTRHKNIFCSHSCSVTYYHLKRRVSNDQP